MTPEERQLISALFDRMRGFSLPQKDAEAEALINEQMTSVRDAPYMLVQSVLVQEHALQQADARIKELEERVRALESEARQERPAAGSGSFLGGLFGGGRASPAAAEGARSSSVPTVGARATPSVYDRPGSSAWSRQPPTQAGGPFAQAQPSGGGFLQSAMTTAAGVAGGMLLAGAISSMLGGNSAAASTPAAAQPAADTDKAQEATQAKDDTDQDGHQDAVQDASYDSGDDGWFGDDSGGDFDI